MALERIEGYDENSFEYKSKMEHSRSIRRPVAWVPVWPYTQEGPYEGTEPFAD
jgi:hypothetical protein